MEDTTSTADTKLVFTDSDAVTPPNGSTPNAGTDASQADLQAQLALFQQQQQQYIQQLVRTSLFFSLFSVKSTDSNCVTFGMVLECATSDGMETDRKSYKYVL